MQPRFHPEARAEYRRHIRYVEEVAEAGDRFIQAVEKTIDFTLKMAGMGSLWPGVQSELEVRRRPIRGFKHISLAYTVIGDQLWVVAVVMERQRPGHWLDRLNDLAPPSTAGS